MSLSLSAKRITKRLKEHSKSISPNPNCWIGFDLIETVEGKGETWFVYVCREIKWYTEDPDIAFLMSCLKEKRTQFAEACEAGYSESWNCTHFEDWVGVQSQPQLVLNV